MTSNTQRITPCLWFDSQAEEAAKFYTSIFENSKIGATAYFDEASAKVSGQPAGSVLTVVFEVEGYQFTALNGGPQFKLNPSISFIVSCATKEEVDELWEKLSDGGKVLMPLDTYAFSNRYGWLEDKYGISWQLIKVDSQIVQKIMPSLMFVGNMYGKADEAMKFYTSIFDNSQAGEISRYSAGQKPNVEGTVMYGDFTLLGQKFAAMDSAREHDFTFNEAISLEVTCQTQQEVDAYWEKLSAVPASEQCGWLKDKFGVSWQIIPKQLPDMLNDPDPRKAGRVMQAMLQMKKIDIATLKRAYEK